MEGWATLGVTIYVMQDELVCLFVCSVKLHLPLRHKENIYMTQMFTVRDGGDVAIGTHPSVFK